MKDASLPQESGKSINRVVFWPPFLLVLSSVILNLVYPGPFREWMKVANTFVLNYFGWLFTLTALFSLLACILICLLPFGRIRLGGENAKPLMSRWNWFAITLCTTVAIGILFWSTAEPLDHYYRPPNSAGVAPESAQSFRFAISTLYLHWTFLPYSIYCAASLMFGFAYYNMKQDYSLGATLVPLIGKRDSHWVGSLIDGICLFSLVAGMAAALGVGILTISGGLNQLLGVPGNRWVWLVITLAIVGSYIASSASGLLNGIRILSDINAKALFLLAAFVLIVGPTGRIFSEGIAAVGDFVIRAPHLAVMEGLRPTDPWIQDWSIFYWAVWIAWTPVTACFLGRIAYGRTVREFVLFNLLLPSLFCMIWMAIFAVTTLDMEAQGLGLFALKEQEGYQAVSNALLNALPLGTALVVYFLLSAFVCFVTSADSNTTAMASLSEKGVTQEDSEGDTKIKIIWGLLVGATAWTMISFTEVDQGSNPSQAVDGVKMLSQLGGLPAAILLILVVAALIRVAWQPKRFDRTTEMESVDHSETAT